MVRAFLRLKKTLEIRATCTVRNQDQVALLRAVEHSCNDKALIII